MKELRVIFEKADWSPEEAQMRIDEAFDILFEEVLLEMQQEKAKKQVKQKQIMKGGEFKNDRLAKSRNESYLGL